MSLRSKWENISVKRKVFITNAIFISMSLVVLYSAIYVFMPKVYQQYKINKINANTEIVRKTLNSDSEIDYKSLLDQFSYDNNVNVVVFGENLNNKYDRIIYSSTRNGSINKDIINFNEKPSDAPDGTEGAIAGKIFGKDKFNQDTQDIASVVYIKSIDKYCYMQVHIPVKPGEEATAIITLFFPFAIFSPIISE